MRKIWYIVLLCIISTLSCSQNKVKKEAKLKDTAVIKKQEIQHTIFGVTLGKTTLQEAENVCLKNGWKYIVQDGFGEICVNILSPVTFGGVQWEQGMDFTFYNNKSSSTGFMINSEATPLNNEQLQAYQTVLNKLKKLYPKHEISTDTLVRSPNKADIVIETKFYAEDSIYSVHLTKDVGGSLNSILLVYMIREDKIDEVIPSDL